MTPDAYCKQKTTASNSSFYYGFLLLPPPRRRAIMALYAFCREVDDIVDECREPSLAALKLAWWRQDIEAMSTGNAQHLVSQALQSVQQSINLPIEQLHEIIDGMEMDLQNNRYPDFKSLHLYCYRAASVVGLLSAEIFGYQNRQTLKYAHDLGLALQLTNIIRDVGEDARRGRIYLPADEMARFGVSETDILSARYSPQFEALMQFQYERAEQHYTQAMQALPPIDRKAQRPGLIMAAIYHALLQEIRQSKFQVLHQRISLPPTRKAWLALKTLAST